MLSPQTDFRISLPSLRHWWLLPAVVLLGIMTLCIFYLSNSYAALAEWMRLLSPDLPHRQDWQRDYFSVETWRRGRWFAGFGIPGCLALAVYCFVQWRRRKEWLPSVAFSREDRTYIPALMAVAIACWWLGQTLLVPGPDEMYSAHYCAAAHPLRTAAYYMDPNNHVLFNLLNGVLFYFSDDKILGGRVLSGIAYVLLLPVVYRFAKRYTGNALAAAMIALVLGLQFQVVGFASLARGYLLYLLLQWLAVAAFCRYWEEKNEKQLLVYALTVAGGFWVMPTFLYLFAALVPAAICIQIRRRRIDRAFWKFTALSLAFTAAVYLPPLLFSGAGAIAGNKFVSPQADMVAGLEKHLSYVVREELWLTYPALSWWPAALFLLPLAGAMLRWKAGLPLLIFTLVWPAYFCAAILMQHFAFLRGLIFQENLTLFLLLLLFQQVGTRLAQRRFISIKKQGRQPAFRLIFILPVTALAIHFLLFFYNNADHALYGLSTREHNTAVAESIRRLPPGTTIAAPDFAIAWQYLGKQAGYPVTVRAASEPGPEAVLVTHYTDEPGPTEIEGYARIREFLFYRIYLRLPVDSGLLKVVEGF